MPLNLFFNRFFLFRLLASKVHCLSVKINPRNEIRRCYKACFNEVPNLEHPRNLIEKTYWMQLYADTSLWTLCADKYRMRGYVGDMGYEEYLPKLLGKWDDPSDIDFDCLPERFVMKANNGCGTVIVVESKATLDIQKTRKEINQWLAIPFGYSGYQPHYLSIKPCIIAEELLIQGDKYNVFSPNSMVDFKVWCINGKAESILVTYNRSSRGHSLDLYDLEWNRKVDCINFNGKFGWSETLIPQPLCLDKMLEIAEKLSEPFPEARIDFYDVNDKPVIGEITLSAGYGNLTMEYYNYLGDKIDLTKVKLK